MRCLNTEEIKTLLTSAGGVELAGALEHVSECGRCQAEFRRLAACAPASVKFSEALLDIAECPDYDALSAFVDGGGDAESARAVRAHVNLCGLCARDVEHIRALRSHADLRGDIEVHAPVRASHSPVWGPLVKRLAAGVVLAGAALAVYVAVVPGVKPVSKATKTSVATQPAPQGQPSGPQVSEPAPGVAVEVKPPAGSASKPAVTSPAGPSYTVVMADGRYRIARQGTRTVVLKDGAAVSVPAGLMAKMVQKITTGKVPVSQPVALAMSSIRVRDSEGYVPPPTAPRLLEPVGKIVKSDRPKLVWSHVELARGYRVSISDAQGNIVYSAVSDRESHVVAVGLERGRVYTWQVGVRFNDSDGWTLSRAAKFKVLASEDLAYLQSVSRLMPGSHLALGVACESVGLADEAAREYRLLKLSNPGVRF